MGACVVATPEPPSQHPASQSGPESGTPSAEQPPISEQLSPPVSDAPPPDATSRVSPPATPPPGVPTPQSPTPPAQPPGPPPYAASPAPPYPQQPMPPGMSSATASQPMWPVQPPQAGFTGQQPAVAPQGPAASYPAMQPVQQPYGYPAAQQAPRRRGPKIPGRDIAAGIALIVAAGLTAGGSFPNLDHAVDHEVNNGQPGAVDNIVDTGAWYFHGDTPGHPEFSYHLLQFFGVGLAVGGLLALVAGVLLVFGLGRRLSRLSTWGAVAAAALFGAVITTLMSVVDDIQADNYAPGGSQFVAGSHVTTPELGFWLLLGAGVVAIVAVVLLLTKSQRTEPPTPRYGTPLPAFQPGAPQAPGYPPQQYPGPQHG